MTFAVMPGDDDVVLLGMAIKKELGVDIYPLALEKLRPRAVSVQIGMNKPSYLPARRIAVPAWSFQSELEKDAGEKEEETPVRRAVQPMGVQPQSQATAEKAQTNCNDPETTGWLTSCISVSVALGLVYCSFQAVWPRARAAMETPEYFCCRRGSESPVGAHIPPLHEDMVHGEDTVHGTRLEEVVIFDVLSDGESDLLGSGGLDDGDPIRDNLLIDNDLSNFVWPESVEYNMDATPVMLKERCDVHAHGWVWYLP